MEVVLAILEIQHCGLCSSRMW